MQMVAPRKKKFGGKWFEFDGGFDYKQEAERRADHLRAGAYNARVVKIQGIRGYFVYYRGVCPVCGTKMFRLTKAQ
jgi:hypothetical protein